MNLHYSFMHLFQETKSSSIRGMFNLSKNNLLMSLRIQSLYLRSIANTALEPIELMSFLSNFFKVKEEEKNKKQSISNDLFKHILLI